MIRRKKPIRRLSPSVHQKRDAMRREGGFGVKPEPTPVAPAAPEPTVDLSLLELSILKLRETLETGDHDAYLAELLAGEEAGENRKGAKSAISERMG